MTSHSARRALTAAALLLAGAASSARAQSSAVPPTVALPPVNILLPNYNGVTIGEIASLEAGAFIVRANDTSSIFYNPAGVTNAERTSISGTAGVFQLSTVTAREAPTSGSSFQQIPAMFAVVVKELFGRPNWAGGLAVSRVNAWGQEVTGRTHAPGRQYSRSAVVCQRVIDGRLARQHWRRLSRRRQVENWRVARRPIDRKRARRDDCRPVS